MWASVSSLCRVMISFSVPGDIPLMFEAQAGQRQVTFSWSPPLLAKDRVTTSYTLSCSPSPSSLPLTTTTLSGSLTVDGFTPNAAYTCYLVATIDVTPGPPANISFITREDCKIENYIARQLCRQQYYSFLDRFIFSVATYRSGFLPRFSSEYL